MSARRSPAPRGNTTLISRTARAKIGTALIALVVIGSSLAVVAPVAVATATPVGLCDTPIVNPVACENTKVGNPKSEWDITGAGDTTIQGFATDISVNVGETARFKIDTDASAYSIAIYRLGYYGGLGARLVDSAAPSASLPQIQPACLTDATTGLVDCGNWGESASWAVPADAVSGIYIARLIRTDTGGASHIVFVVRNDASHSDVMVQTSDAAWEAYNNYGGASLYAAATATGRATKVSYNRPFNTRANSNEDWLFHSEYPMLRWLESNGYDLSYTTDVDSDRRGSLIQQHKTFVSVGHDEYWSAAQRSNVELARDQGVNLAFFSGNSVFWKFRWEPSIDASATTDRTIVTYKETYDGAVTDPDHPEIWTGTWRDPRFTPPTDGGRPENALMGTMFMVNGAISTNRSIIIPALEGKARFWRDTTVANLAAGTKATLPIGSLGYEWDSDIDNGSRPAGLVQLSTSTYSVTPNLLLDYGTTYGAGSATHHLTMYKASSGALVFGAGTVQWSWGLNATHDPPGMAVDVRMQQATVNLLADMHNQPATLQSPLTLATASSDTVAPVSTITSPVSGDVGQVGTTITIAGTATDSGGGIVGAVEISTDDGTTWHPATGRDSWTYSFTPLTPGPISLLSRATDDSGNLSQPLPATTLAIAAYGNTVFSADATPTVITDTDASSIEVGMKFRSSTNGFISGVRFFKSAINTGTHTGTLWSASGTQLATTTFTNESTSGWQQATFSAPVAITADTVYVISYHAPNGHYSADDNYFTQSIGTGALHGLANSESANGVYRYSSTVAFPTSSNLATNYWVDAVYSIENLVDTTPPSVIDFSPASDAIDVSTASSVHAQFSELVDPTSISFNLTDSSNTSIPATVTYDSTTSTAILRVAAALATSATYTAVVSGATDLAGNVMTGNQTWSFTTAAVATQPGTGVFADGIVPDSGPDTDTAAVEIGMKFKSDNDGFITGVRFFKDATNTGTHSGALWTANGTLLASVVFADETASGWQQATFSSAVPVTANTVYVISYHAPLGHYSVTEQYFDQQVDNAPVHGLATTESANGVYTYSGSEAFPSSTYRASNYWVDATYSPTDPNQALIPGAPTGVTATVANASSVVSWTAPIFNGGSTITGYTITSNPGALTCTTTTLTCTVSGLTNGTAYTYSATARNAAGTSSSSVSSPPSGSATDTTTANFAAGTLGAAIYGAETADGEISLVPASGTEFGGTALPTTWSAAVLAKGGTTTVSGGQAVLNGTRIRTTGTFSSLRSVEFAATFSGAANQDIGFGADGTTAPWAMFTTQTSGSLAARTSNGTTNLTTAIAGSWYTGPHRFRIDWNASNVVYSIDGVVVVTHAATLTTAMPFFARDAAATAGTVALNWTRVSPYGSTGVFTSRVLDAGIDAVWRSSTFTGALPAGTTRTIRVRSGSTAIPGGSWTAWATIATSGSLFNQPGRYLQYDVTFATTKVSDTPTLDSIAFSFG